LGVGDWGAAVAGSIERELSDLGVSTDDHGRRPLGVRRP
jgi:hypothetical protein